jgi:hypothetical protein
MPDDHVTLSTPIQCRLAMPKESPMNVQCIWRRKYSLGFRVGFVDQGVPVPDGPKRAKPRSMRCK